jgi:hypothetical protein
MPGDFRVIGTELAQEALEKIRERVRRVLQWPTTRLNPKHNMIDGDET